MLEPITRFRRTVRRSPRLPRSESLTMYKTISEQFVELWFAMVNHNQCLKHKMLIEMLSHVIISASSLCHFMSDCNSNMRHDHDGF